MNRQEKIDSRLVEVQMKNSVDRLLARHRQIIRVLLKYALCMGLELDFVLRKEK